MQGLNDTKTKLVLVFSLLLAGSELFAVTEKGQVERIVVHGKSLVGNLAGDPPDRHISVYLPPGYNQKNGRHYPVLYLLHGFTNSDYRWFGIEGGETFANLPVAADNAIEAGANGLIIVMPDAFTKYQGSMYSNSVTTGNWEAFIVEDLVAHIDKHYKTLAHRNSRGLAGHSMGGYGAIRIGMKFPLVFSSLYAMNPCCLTANLHPNPELVQKASVIHTDEDILNAEFLTKAVLASAAAWSPNPTRPPRYLDLPIEDGQPRPEVIARWAANAPMAMIHQYISGLRQYNAIGLEAGNEEPGIAPATSGFSKALGAYGIKHFIEIYPGGHRDQVAQRLEKTVLPFFSSNLKF